MDNKLRILKLLDIFVKYTDEDNLLSMQEIILLLEKEDFTVSRKAIYDDIKALRSCGYDIEIIKGSQMKYHLLNHPLDMVEAKILYDSIFSINFLSVNKANKISDKLLKSISKYQKKSIVNSSKKTINKYNNDKTLYIINDLQNAINNNNSVSFNYFDVTIDNKKKYRKEKTKYTLLPYALVLIQQRYYCIFYSLKYEAFSNYRVDKIDNLTIEKDVIEKIPFNLDEYLSKTFNMFAGKTENITIKFQNELLGVVIDQFGNDLLITNKTNNSFTINITTTVSNNFLSWLSQFGNKIKIISPSTIIQRYKQHLQNIIDMY